ncbi:MAG TPA: hypothetical protein VFU21_15935 [Kofleriaceae bacterium]|nr:hypothetical protein [Kofleriaceae bacterium]
MRCAAAALLLLAAACGGEDRPAQPDGGSAGSYTPRECALEFGHTQIFSRIVILPEEQGIDITGDGVPDNQLGRIAPLSNPTIVSVIENGTGIFLLDFTRWEGAPADDDDMDVTFYLGVDADMPPDPSDNTSGSGEFRVVDRQLDVECNPLTRVAGKVKDGIVRAESGVWNFLIEGIGTLTFDHVHLELGFDDQLEHYTGRFGTGWTVCSLSHVEGPLFAGGSLLESVVNDLELPDPDLDFDGDGLEHVVGDGEAITSCIDGDGTVIEGADCPCDPRIGDAYSVSVAIEGAAATISGIIYDQ